MVEAKDGEEEVLPRRHRGGQRWTNRGRKGKASGKGKSSHVEEQGGLWNAGRSAPNPNADEETYQNPLISSPLQQGQYTAQNAPSGGIWQSQQIPAEGAQQLGYGNQFMQQGVPRTFRTHNRISPLRGR